MNPEIVDIKPGDGTLELKIKVNAEDVAAARAESHEQLAFENGFLSVEEVDQKLFPTQKTRFELEYTLSKAVNYAIMQLGIMTCASSEIDSGNLTGGEDEFEFDATVFPYPEMMLTSADPISLKGKRIPMPGVSMEAAAAGEDVEYVADDKMLEIEIPKRLRANISDALMQHLVNEQGQRLEGKLQAQGMTVEQYRQQSNMDEDHLNGLLTMEASKQIKLDLALDLFSEALEIEVTDEDLDAAFETMLPGQGATIRKFYENHGDLFVVVGQVRRRKTYEWLAAHVD